MAKRDKKLKKASRKKPAALTALDKRRKKNAGAAPAELPQLDDKSKKGKSDAGNAALARIDQLEADRTNLMAQVAWARAVAQEQQKALEVERERSEKLAADLEAQRSRIEQLKALTVLDRLLGRHKRI